MRALALLAMIACSSPQHPPERPQPQTFEITGRVTLDGKPVPYFGVKVMHFNPEFEQFMPTELEPVQSSDGRFAREMPAGVWDVVIVGPGFVRRVLTNIGVGIIGRAPVAMPLEIAVSRGRAIEGRVTDSSNQPVRGAIVRIVQRHSIAEDRIRDVARGNYRTMSDSSGRFRLEGIDALHDDATIFASERSHGVSFRSRLRDLSSVTLVLTGAGTIEGAVTGKRPHRAVVVARPVAENAAPLRETVRGDGSFRFDHVPVGDYDVSAAVRDVNRFEYQRVSVTAGQPSRVMLAMP